MNGEFEYETTAIVGGKETDVLIVWEAEDYEPLGITVYIGPEYDEEANVSEAEYDRLYSKAIEVTQDRFTDMAETYADMER